MNYLSKRKITILLGMIGIAAFLSGCGSSNNTATPPASGTTGVNGLIGANGCIPISALGVGISFQAQGVTVIPAVSSLTGSQVPAIAGGIIPIQDDYPLIGATGAMPSNYLNLGGTSYGMITGLEPGTFPTTPMLAGMSGIVQGTSADGQVMINLSSSMMGGGMSMGGMSMMGGSIASGMIMFSSQKLTSMQLTAGTVPSYMSSYIPSGGLCITGIAVSLAITPSNPAMVDGGRIYLYTSIPSLVTGGAMTGGLLTGGALPTGFPSNFLYSGMYPTLQQTAGAASGQGFVMQF